MYTDILQSIEGIEIYPVLSLVLFVAVFGGVLWWAIRADKTRLARYAALPFDEPMATPAGHESADPSRRRQP
jgi:hypothetical protein